MKRLLILTIALLTTITTHAKWCYPVINYTVSDFNGGRQSWKITEGENGLIFFANNNGMLEYSNIGWKLHHIDNGSVMRAATATSNNKIYVGALNEFGCFSPDETGRLTYTNLSKEVSTSQLLSNEIWDIHQISSRTLFRTRREIIARDSYGNIETMPSDGLILASCTMNSNLYFATANGIFVVGEGAPLAISTNDNIPYEQISAMASLSGTKLLVATSFDGLYLFENGEFSRFKSTADQILKDHQAFSLTTNDDYIACGTVSEGVVLISLDGQEYEHIYINNGLMNNTVLCVMFDSNKNLWCGLDNGIARIITDTPIKHYSSSLNDHFSGYCAHIKGDYIYMGTNQGLLKVGLHNPDQATPPIIKNSEGQVWNITKIEDDIYCCHTRGLFKLDESGAEPTLSSIYTEDGVWNISQINPSNYLINTYEGLLNMTRTKTGEYITQPIKGYDNSAQHIYLHSPSQSLFALDEDGLKQLRLVNDLEVSHKTLIKNNSFSTKVIVVDKQFVVYTPTQIYIIDDNGELATSNMYDYLFEHGREYTMINVDDNYNLWLINKGRLLKHEFNHSTKTYDTQPIQLHEERHLFIPRFSMIEAINQRYSIVNSIYGFSIIDSEWQPTKDIINKPTIYGVYDTENRDSLLLSNIYGVANSSIELPYSQNSLRLLFGNASSSNQTAQYSFRLRGYDNEWSEWSDELIEENKMQHKQKEYTNLREGNYYFEVRLQDRSGAIKTDSLKITIAPPWQRSTPMIILYIMMGIAALLYTRYRVIKHFEVRRRLAELQKERETERQKRTYESRAIEQENNIIRLKNESLENEVAMKSAELSNLLMNKLEKNDIITNVKGDLEKIRVEMVNERYSVATKRITTLGRRLDDRMIDNVDWAAFEKNFNTINNNFAHKLTERYGWMNLNERKLCIYIKMGLQNKEIAPLLNLSVRGVEMLRYRVRKKMDIDRNRSLFEYLQTI